ncbi:Ubiquitin-like-specific protease 1, partial [Frankliniella fusca]
GDTPQIIMSPDVKYAVGNMTIYETDWSSLAPKSWLTDIIIDTFLSIVTSKDNLFEKEAAVFLLHSLALDNATMGVQSIFSRAASDWILNDVWIVPTHINRNHWILLLRAGRDDCEERLALLLLVLIKAKKIVILDSMNSSILGNSVTEHLQVLRHLLAISHKHTFAVDINWADWSVNAPHDMGRQSNSFDCGLCVCVWVLCLCTATAPPSVTENCNSSDKIRHWMKTFIFSNAVKSLRLDPKPPSTTPNQPDVILEEYSTFDKEVESGSLIIPKPWETLPTVKVLTSGWETTEMLGNVMRNLWTATDTHCVAKKMP